MANQPGTNRQVPEHSIMDYYNKQVYLGNGYSVPVSVTLSDNSETAGLLIVNPLVATAAFPSGYFSQFMEGSHFTCTGNMIVRYYLNPTIATKGTASDVIQRRPASTNASVAQVYADDQFSVSSNGTLVDLRAALAEAQTIDNIMIILDPGQSMLITFQTTASSTNTVLGAIPWSEF
jgi:hypothetical protein